MADPVLADRRTITYRSHANAAITRMAGVVWRIGCVLIVATIAFPLRADDVLIVTTVRQLALTEGKLPAEDPRLVQWRRAIPPVRVQLDGDGEAIVEPYAKPGGGRGVGYPSRNQKIAIRTSGAGEIQGTLFWPVRDGETVSVRFRVDRTLAGPGHAKAFHELKADYYGRLLEQGGPGAAWFRHQILEARRALGQFTSDTSQLAPGERTGGGGWLDVRGSLELMSGERALHENLQLDRQLPITEAAEDAVDVQSIAGISIREFDWRKAVRDLKPAKDRLARYVPADQHAVLFPSFAAAVATLERFDQLGGGAWQTFEASGMDLGLQRRYERQLGLSLGGAARLLGPRLIGAVAVTGGDPYYRAGTDIAVLLEPAAKLDSATLEQAIVAQIAAATRAEVAVESTQGELAGVRFTSRRSPDRRVSSYVARLDDVVVVSNSSAQLQRLIDVSQGRTPPLDSLDEFTFFRERYRLGAPEESALVVISDATIRRWCGPVWRIGASRRLRAAAILAETQARNLASLVARDSTAPGDAVSPNREQGGAIGELSWNSVGVVSSVYGSLEFQTPIGELNVRRVTKDEARLYVQWRDQYQSYWRGFFDPIAVRLNAGPHSLAFDMTVMPLIDQTVYRTPRELAGKSAIPPNAADRHAGTLIRSIMSIDRDSKNWLFDGSTFLFGPTGSAGDIRKWLGPTISAYVDDDPIWEKLAHASEQHLTDQDALAEARLPVALRLDVIDQVALSAAREHLRRVITGLGIQGEWKTRSHRRQEYSVFAPAPESRPQYVSQNLQLFTLAAGDQWLLTLNEPLLKRAIDRQLERDAAKGPRDAKPAGDNETRNGAATDGAANESLEVAPPWLGRHFTVELNGQAAAALRGMLAMNYGRQAQLASWRNLPILTEWKRRFPREDPVRLHERLWHVRLTCPGGGEYRWNERFQTMESSFFGHPDAPRNDRVPPPLFNNLKRLGAGLSFEPDGLRARGVWETTP